MFDLKIFSIFRFCLECFCTCSAYAMMSLIFKVLPLPTVELVEGPSSRTLRHGSLLRERGCGIIEVLLNTCGTFPEYATVCNLLGGQTPGANPPLESLELQSDGILMVTCSWPHLTVEAEKFPAGVPRDEDKQCHQQWVRSWMDDGCICKDNKQMNHDTSDIYIYWNYRSILMETWICRICITCFAWNGPRMV